MRSGSQSLPCACATALGVCALPFIRRQGRCRLFSAMVGHAKLSFLHEGSSLQRLGAASPNEEASRAENASSMPAGAQTSLLGLAIRSAAILACVLYLIQKGGCSTAVL